MTKIAFAKSICRSVCEHYSLPKDVTKIALVACALSPARAIVCYSAILNSLKEPTEAA